MNKKIFVFLILLLVVSFSTHAFASLTFTSNAITGTTASTIDLGSGNTLSLNTISNAPITTGTGLVTFGGNLKVTSLTYDAGEQNLYISNSGTSTPNLSIERSLYNTDFLDGFVSKGIYSSSTTSFTNAPSITTTATLVSSIDSIPVGIYGSGTLSGSISAWAIGLIGQGSGGASPTSKDSVGVFGFTKKGSSPIRSIGMWGSVPDAISSTTGTVIGGNFEIGASTLSNLTSAALIANNGATTSPVFLGRDNGSTVFTIADGGAVTSTSTMTSTQYKLSALNTAPSSAADTGTVGEIRWANGYVYLCVATNTWQRAALASW